MANLKISQLTPGNPAQSGDLLPIDRAGVNFSISAGSIAALAGSGTVTSFSAASFDSIATAAVANPTTTPALTFTLSTQTANTIWAGPTTGAAANPTFRALVSGDIPNNAANTSGTAAGLTGTPSISITNLTANGTTSFAAGSIAYAALSGTPTIPADTWSSQGNATGNLTLSNAGYTTEFDQTSAVTWLWANTTVATSLTTNASPLLEVAANYWTGAASAKDLWSLGTSLIAGTNGASTLTIAHAGSTGAVVIAIPAAASINGSDGVVAAPTFSFATQKNTGIYYHGGLTICSGGSDVFATGGGANGFARVASNGIFAFTSGAVTTTAQDTAISRLGAASLAIGNGIPGNTTGNLSFNRVSLSGADFAGQVTITAASTTNAVTFAANYTCAGPPIVCLTPTTDPLTAGVPVGYWVTYQGSTGAWSGFTANIQSALAGNVTFNYLIVSNR